MNTAATGILLVANYESDVGYAWWLMEEFWAAIARHFAAHGLRSYLIYPRMGAIPQTIREAPIETIELDFEDRTPAGRERLRRFIQERKIRYAYLTDKNYVDSYYRKLRHWGVRHLVMHDHMPGERTLFRGPRLWARQLLHVTNLASCDLYIGVSEFVCERLRRNAGVPASRVACVLNGIRPVGRDPALRHYAHREFGIPEGSLIVITVGRATRYKGIQFVIECARALGNSTAGVYFLHCGDGPDLDEFRALAGRYGLSDRFLFAGRRSDVRQILQSCDIAMHASEGEAFSLAILEYLSAGLPALVPDNCGNREAVRDGVTGFLYRTGDRNQACALLDRLIRDGVLREQLGSAAEREVRERFSLDAASRRLTALLDPLWTSPPTREPAKAAF